MSETNGVAARVSTLERDVRESKADRRELWEASTNHKTEIALLHRDLREVKDDLRSTLDELRWVRRGLWAAAATFLGLGVTIALAVFNHT